MGSHVKVKGKIHKLSSKFPKTYQIPVHPSNSAASPGDPFMPSKWEKALAWFLPLVLLPPPPPPTSPGDPFMPPKREIISLSLLFPRVESAV